MSDWVWVASAFLLTYAAVASYVVILRSRLRRVRRRLDRR